MIHSKLSLCVKITHTKNTPTTSQQFIINKIMMNNDAKPTWVKSGITIEERPLLEEFIKTKQLLLEKERLLPLLSDLQKNNAYRVRKSEKFCQEWDFVGTRETMQRDKEKVLSVTIPPTSSSSLSSSMSTTTGNKRVVNTSTKMSWRSPDPIG